MTCNPWFAEFTELITPDGLVYRFDAGDRFLVSEEGLGLPPIEYLTQRGPLQHGETVVDYRLAKRVIQLVERQDTCSRYDYWTERTNLLNAVRPNRQNLNPYTGLQAGTLRKKLPNGNIRDIDVFIEQGPGFVARESGVWDEWGFTEALRFVAHDPTFYDPTVMTFTLDLDESTYHLIFPFVFHENGLDNDDLLFGPEEETKINILNYTGNWFSFPTITLLGPINNARITNTTIDEYIEITYDIAAGETVTFGLAYGNKTVTSSLGTDLIGTVTEGSKLSTFRIECAPQAPLGANTISLQGSGADANTLLTFTYYTRYIGI